eukprot:764138-Hanusia_phi.AAC.4
MADSKLRIGYLSGSGFHASTTTANFIVGVLKMHSRKLVTRLVECWLTWANRRVQVHCFALAEDDRSEVRSEIRKACFEFIDMHDLDNLQAANNINSRRIQVHWHGYPGTLGRELVDYFAGDVVSCPPDLRSSFHESLLLLPFPYLANSFLLSHSSGFLLFLPPRLPALVTFFSPPTCPALASLLSHELDMSGKSSSFPTINKTEIFGVDMPNQTLIAVFSQPYKIDREILHVWAKILLVRWRIIERLQHKVVDPTTQQAERSAVARSFSAHVCFMACGRSNFSASACLIAMMLR